MMFKKISSLPKNINFINTKSFKFEDEFYILKKIFEVEIYNVDNIKLDNNKKYLTINLDYYLKHKNEINLDLLIISVDNDNSHFLNLIKYLKTNNFKKFRYNKNDFKKFLSKNFPLKEINSKINKFLSFFGLKIGRHKINKYINIPKINIIDDIYRGFGIGISSYNFYVPRNKEFDLIFDTVCANLSDNFSKKIYHETVYGRPSTVWENYFNLLFENEHYQDYLEFKNSNIINLGVDNGFEIPFFITNEIKNIINVDPTEEHNLDPYVKSFVNNYKDKVIFDGSFLYDDSNVYVDITAKNKVTNLTSIIEKYNLKENLIIKSDIEGLEIKMVDELLELVPKYRPQLAISIYHVDKNFFPRHSQLVVIPERLIKICKNYKFFIRHYTYNRRETVLFCMPDEKIS